jgi:hypothetical protein
MKPFRPRMQGNWPPIPPAHGPARPAAQPQEQFQSFKASSLYCPQCQQATPVRERLLLVLPDGNLYEYRCVYCGSSTGSKTEKERVNMGLLF